MEVPTRAVAYHSQHSGGPAMKRAFFTLPIFLIGLLLLFVSRSYSQDATVERSDAIQKCVKEFLAGSGSDEVLAYTSGGKFQEQAPKAPAIKEAYKNTQVVFAKAVFLSSGTAVVLATTKSAKGMDQLHTFVLQEKQPKQWKVKAWHTSHE
jgi:hypothetical protein